MLALWGRFVYRARWHVLVLSVLLLAVAVAVIQARGPLDPPDVPAETESGRALALIGKELPAQPATFTLVFSSRTLPALDPAFRAEVERALAPLARDPRVARIHTAYGGPPGAISRDGRRTLAVVELRERATGFTALGFSGLPPDLYPALRALVRSATLEVLAAGPIPINHDFAEVAREDLGRVEMVILPLVTVLLLLVFGSVVAALLPLAVGGLAMASAIAGTFLLARVVSVSIYAPNIVSMIGLGVAIDYSLFIVSRFREELLEHPTPEALARTLATAGRAIFFSGLTVAIGLLGLMCLGLGNLGSMGWAGTLVVGFAVLYGLTTLPALLAVLGPRVNAARVPFLGRGGPEARGGAWRWIATVVMTYPWRVLLPVVALLLVTGLPLLHLRVGAGDETALPPEVESRRSAELLRREFPGEDVNRILVVLDAGRGSAKTPERAAQAAALSQWLAARPHVSRVDGLGQLVGDHVAMLVVSTALRPSGDEARALVREIRTTHPPFDGEVLVAGQTAFDLDFIDLAMRRAPLAIGLIVFVTFLVMFFLLESVLLPLKAVVMNLLSITASFGALVWIFQDGHLAGWLGFTPGPIQTATPLIMFCLVFGLSMDYEVLLLSRVREEYDRTGDNTQAVAAALERTGRLITGAAAIMAAVLFGFGLARSVIVQAVGIGIGIAVVVDATIVRALLVPATMRLMGRWNWWRPRWVGRRRVRASEREDQAGGGDERRSHS